MTAAKFKAFNEIYQYVVDDIYAVCGQLIDSTAKDAFILFDAVLDVNPDVASRMAAGEMRRTDAMYIPEEYTDLAVITEELDEEQWQDMQRIFQRMAQALGYGHDG